MTACEGAGEGGPGLKGGQEGATPRRDGFINKGSQSRKIKQGEKKDKTKRGSVLLGHYSLHHANRLSAGSIQ